MKDEIRLCQCGEPAIFHAITNWYDRMYNEKGICYSALKKSGSQQVCVACLQHLLERYESAHHMVWKIKDIYQPDSFNFDRLLRESVEAVADYRDQSVEDFLAGLPWGVTVLA